MAESLDLPIQPVSGRTRLITEMQLAIAASQLADQPLYHRRRTRYIAEKAHLAAALALGNRHRMLRLRRVERDKRFAILPHGPPSVHEARLRPPQQPPLLFLHEKGGRLPHHA